MPYRRNENIFELTHRLRQSQTRSTARYALWVTLGAGFYLAYAVATGYWKATTGHTLLECTVLHSQGCEAPSMKIHGE